MKTKAKIVQAVVAGGLILLMGIAGWWIGTIANADRSQPAGPEPVATASQPQPQVADIKADWSNVENPHRAAFGTWSFNLENTPLSPVASWSALAPVSGWGTSANVRGNDCPIGFRAPPNLTQPLEIGPDYEEGDIVFHTTDRFSSRGAGEANITWKPSQEGEVAVALALWPTRRIGRLNHWQLAARSADSLRVLGEGSLPEDGTCTRSRPAALTLESVKLNQADILELRLNRSPQASDPSGDFVGIRFTINAAGTMASRPVAAVTPVAQPVLLHHNIAMIIALCALALSICACVGVAWMAIVLRRGPK